MSNIYVLVLDINSKQFSLNINKVTAYHFYLKLLYYIPNMYKFLNSHADFVIFNHTNLFKIK